MKSLVGLSRSGNTEFEGMANRHTDSDMLALTNTLFTLQTEANRTAESTPFTLAQNAQQCAFHNSILFTLAHSRMRFVSHWKRSEAHYSVLLWVALLCLKSNQTLRLNALLSTENTKLK